MSNLTVKGNASGTGTVILEAPNTNTNRTITLPDATATLATTADSITQTQLETALNADGDAPIYACRAWVNFNGTGTVAIRAAGNVTSITDLGVGTYQVNFGEAMQDANYAPVASVDGDGPGLRKSGLLVDTVTAGSFIVRTGSSSGGEAVDRGGIFAAIFR